MTIFSSRNKQLRSAYQTYTRDLATATFRLNQDPESINKNKVGEGSYTTEQLIGQLSAGYIHQFDRHHVDALLLVEARASSLPTLLPTQIMFLLADFPSYLMVLP